MERSTNKRGPVLLGVVVACVLVACVLVACVLVACVFVACVFVAVGYTSFRDYSFHQRQFDSSAWRAGDVRVRGQMSESLGTQSLLRDKTRDEVLALLGKPDEDHEWLLRYRVDVGRRFAWRPFLVTVFVELDDKMHVYRVGIVD